MKKLEENTSVMYYQWVYWKTEKYNRICKSIVKGRTIEDLEKSFNALMVEEESSFSTPYEIKRDKVIKKTTTTISEELD